MSSPASPKVPRQLRHEPDPNRSGHYRLVSPMGDVWAEGIPSEDGARLFASSPPLLLGYSDLLKEAYRFFKFNWELDFSGLELQDFADDDGPLEEEYPDAPAYASWLLELQQVITALPPYGREAILEKDEEPQLALF